MEEVLKIRLLFVPKADFANVVSDFEKTPEQRIADIRSREAEFNARMNKIST